MRESVMCVGERKRGCVCVRERKRENERECNVCRREEERVCVFVSD